MPNFLSHTTTACPVPPNTPTTIKLRSGAEIATKRPQDWLWGRASSPNPGEIVAYRIEETEAA